MAGPTLRVFDLMSLGKAWDFCSANRLPHAADAAGVGPHFENPWVGCRHWLNKQVPLAGDEGTRTAHHSPGWDKAWRASAPWPAVPPLEFPQDLLGTSQDEPCVILTFQLISHQSDLFCFLSFRNSSKFLMHFYNSTLLWFYKLSGFCCHFSVVFGEKRGKYVGAVYPFEVEVHILCWNSG